MYGGEAFNGFSISKGKESIKAKCVNQHVFYIPTSELKFLDMDNNEDCCAAWCHRCIKFFDSVQAVAAKVNLQVLGGPHVARYELICCAN